MRNPLIEKKPKAKRDPKAALLVSFMRAENIPVDVIASTLEISLRRLYRFYRKELEDGGQRFKAKFVTHLTERIFDKENPSDRLAALVASSRFGFAERHAIDLKMPRITITVDPDDEEDSEPQATPPLVIESRSGNEILDQIPDADFEEIKEHGSTSDAD